MKNDEYLLWKQWFVTKDPEKLNQLYNSFQPLIKNAVNRFKNAPVPVEAVEMEAKKLFLHGLKTYDPQRAKLNTHLTNQLKPLYRYVAQNQNIGYIPEVRIRKIGAFNVANEELGNKFGRPPTAMEISNKMGIDISEVSRLQHELRGELIESYDDFSTVFQKPDSKKDILFYVYHELSPSQKLVFEHLTGLTGRKQIKKSTNIAKELNMPIAEVRKLKKQIADKLEPYKDL